MRIEPRLVTKIASYTPKKKITAPDGNKILVIPQGEVHMYLTFEGEKQPERVLFLEIEHMHGITLMSYTPMNTGTGVYHSRDGIVALASPDVEYEELG